MSLVVLCCVINSTTVVPSHQSQTKGLDIENVTITHAQANRAPKMRRRTYRAHGRINPYLSCPAHIEIIAEERNQEIAKESEAGAKKVTKKVAAQLRAKTVKSGGGVNYIFCFSLTLTVITNRMLQ
jgi:hypothetical protein